MTNTMIMTSATLRSSRVEDSLSRAQAGSAVVIPTGVGASWLVGMAGSNARTAFAPRHRSVSAVRLTDVVPATAGRGVYTAKQDRPPRGEPR